MPFTQSGFTLVQARFQRDGDTTFRAADNVINTFCFHSANSLDPHEEIRGALDAFYYTAAGGGSTTVGSLLSRAITGLVYVMREADAAPGTPGIEIPSLAFTRATQTSTLPPDCAVCLSYRADPPYTARRRGRIYLGPLNNGSLAPQEGTIGSSARGVINGAALRLAEWAETGDVTWGIASRAGDFFSRIMEGYVDTHYDTQRRRDPGTEVFGRHPSDWQVVGV